MTVRRTIDHTPVPVHIWTEDVTPEAVRQLEHVARLPFVHSHVAAMPDVHVGVGSTIGSVIPTRGAIVPAAVGVDIGCGMIAARLSLDASALPDSLGADDLVRQTAGVECRKDEGVVDEIPAAYKDIDEVMANQDDLVEVVHTLRQVVCVKG